MSALVTRETCGRCGVYRKHHPLDRCKGLRLSWWWDRHSLVDHVGVWLWIHALTSKARWAIAGRMQMKGLCWCDLVDSVVKADDWNDSVDSVGRKRGYRHDYSGEWGCLCDFPAPWTVKPPVIGQCYCPPPGALDGDA